MNTVNLFFACDDNYVPFLAVTLTSIRETCDHDRHYAVRILQTGIREESKQRLTAQFTAPNFSLEFVDVSPMLAEISDQLHTRDYYSKSTYYRLFIPELFPQLDKALYLDCDIVLTGDVSQLYDTPLEDHLVAAVPDGAVAAIAPFREYVSKRLRVDPANYFNAGVLLMNLEQMRRCDFTGVFLRLLGAVTFRVAQDQDYLNVICRNRVYYLSPMWNTMPSGIPVEQPQLIHYNLDSKPWQRDDVAYGELFWDMAERSGFLPEILAIRSGFTQERIEHSAQQTQRLIYMGQRQARHRTKNLWVRWKINRVVNL